MSRIENMRMFVFALDSSTHTDKISAANMENYSNDF